MECWSPELFKDLLNRSGNWFKTNRSIAHFNSTIGTCEIRVTVCKNNESLWETVDKLLPSEYTSLSCNLLRYGGDGVPSSSSRCPWIEHWSRFCARLRISYAVVEQETSQEFFPLRIHPHIVPYYAIIVTNSCIATVTPALKESEWCPLESILRFHTSHFDYESQGLNYLTAQLSELFAQLCSMSIFPKEIPLNTVLCDNALWLMCDPIQSIIQNCTGTEEEHRLSYYTDKWICRQLSNYDYITKLNEFAGRKRGEVHNHPVFPWVCDFCIKDGGWRKMNRTKYRLNKGDDQLREMYSRSPAHHIPELLSDIGYMVYRARIESKENLCKHVRSKWVPLEYPVSLQRMYDWTPDECIPEFYDCPEILVSQHSDMPSLELPAFVSTPHEFITWHRKMLESDHISAELHHWIDLTFGYLLKGEEAVRSLNVHLSLVEPPNRKLRRNGVVQLFSHAHPARTTETDDILYNNQIQRMATRENTPDQGNQIVPKETDDENDLLPLYRELLLQKKNHPAHATMKSILLLAAQIGLAPKLEAQFDEKNVITVLQQHAYLLPRSMYELLHLHLIENTPMPTPIEFSMYLCSSIGIQSDLINLHDIMATFYSLNQLRNSPAVKNNEKREQSILIRELDTFRLFIQNANALDFVVVPIFERLLKDPVASITAVHRLVAVICQKVSEESMLELISPLTALISCENSIKLLDRRFLLHMSVVYGAHQFLDRFLPSIVEAVAAKQLDRSLVAKDSLLWLSRRYGPVVCARYISVNLLRILASCYDGLLLAAKSQLPNNISVPLVGDDLGCRVEASLTEIAASYSVTFVTVQYLPFCVDLVDQSLRRMTTQLESGLVSVCRIVALSMKAMSDNQLMNYLEDYIVDKLLLRMLQHVIAKSSCFTTERSRLIVLCRTIHLLYDVAMRIGAENTRLHAKKLFDLLFNAFSSLYETDEELRISQREPIVDENLYSIPLWLISSMIDRFATAWGVPVLSSLCPDPAFLVSFVSSRVSTGSPVTSPSIQPSSISSSYQFGCLPSGNRLFSLSSSSNLSSGSVGGVGACETGSLSSIWCARVSAACCSQNGRASYRFDHLPLCSFDGHSGSIRCTLSLSNENSFISGSSDKTIKLWSMRPEFDRVEAQWTYRGHSRPINDITTVNGNAIASTDGNIHVWDPFRGSQIFGLDWNEGNVCALSRIDRSTVAAISSLHSTVKLFDTRMGDWSAELKVTTLSGLTRAITSTKAGSRVAVCLSNGTIVCLDVRTGKLMSLSHGNNTHSTQMHWMANGDLVVCDSDETAVVFDTTSKIIHSRRLHDTVTCSSISGDILATIQNSSMLRLYNDKDLVMESNLKESLQVTPTSLTYLSMNNAYLIGTSNGSLKLMC